MKEFITKYSVILGLILFVYCQSNTNKNENSKSKGIKVNSITDIIDPIDTLVQRYKRIANNYHFNGRVPTITHPDKAGMDTVRFDEQNPFYDNDNIIVLNTGKSIDRFVNFFKMKYRKSALQSSESISLTHYQDVNEWSNIIIDTLSNLKLKIQAQKTDDYYQKIEFNFIALQVLDSLNRNILKNNTDTLRSLLNYFKKLADSTILNKPDEFKLKDNDIPDINIKPINYSELSNLIKYPLELKGIAIIEFYIMVNEMGNVIKYNKIRSVPEDTVVTPFEKIFIPFIDKFQYPILKIKNVPIQYYSRLHFVFTPNHSSFHRSILDSLYFYNNRDTFEMVGDSYRVYVGNLFNRKNRHALFLYEQKDIEFWFGELNVTLYSYEYNKWIRKQSFIINGLCHAARFIDVNWDNNIDILLPNRPAEMGSGNQSYNLFLYDTVYDCLKVVPEFTFVEQSDMYEMHINKRRKIIGAFSSGGVNGQDNKQLYAWQEGKLVLLKGVYLYTNIDDIEEYSLLQKYTVENRIKTLGKERKINNIDKAYKEYKNVLWKSISIEY